MRKNESAQVKRALARAGFDDLVVVDASDVFIDAVKDIFDPEKKRKIIGKTFLQIKDIVMKDYNLDANKYMLGQGTIYPDTIETGGTKHSDTIKTHHNRVEEVLKLMKMGHLIEPIKDLYKDEVRELGKKIKLPKNLLDRHPFPGPGLAIRALCSNGQERIKNRSTINSRLQKIVGSKLQSTVLPIKSVGVQGDNRTYRHPALLAMSDIAENGYVGHRQLESLSSRITNSLPEVNRVVYLLHPKKIDFKKLRTKKSIYNKRTFGFVA